MQISRGRNASKVRGFRLSCLHAGETRQVGRVIMLNGYSGVSKVIICLTLARRASLGVRVQADKIGSHSPKNGTLSSRHVRILQKWGPCNPRFVTASTLKGAGHECTDLAGRQIHRR